MNESFENTIFRAPLAHALPYAEVCSLFGYPAPRDGAFIGGVTVDSRLARKGDLFFALKGENRSGEDFIPDVLRHGGFAVSEKPIPGALCVNDAKAALLALASRYRERFFAGVPLIAVTGSVGKTTTKDFLRAILRRRFSVSVSEKNHNNEIGVPMSMLSAKADADLLLLEMGMNAAGELLRYSEALAPNYAVITKIGTAHVGNLGSREAVARAKTEITAGMPRTEGRVLIPYGEPLLSGISGALTVSASDQNADFALLSTDRDTAFYRKGSLLFRNLPRLPKAEDLRECLAFAVTAAVLCGIVETEIEEALLSLEIPRRRIPEKVESFYLLDDSYNASYESMIAGLHAVEAMAFPSRSALLGDMEDLGSYTEEIHRAVGRAYAESGFRSLFLFGRYAPFYALGAKEGGMRAENLFVFNDPLSPAPCAECIRDRIEDGEILFAKASHKIDLSRVLDRLRR